MPITRPAGSAVVADAVVRWCTTRSSQAGKAVAPTSDDCHAASSAIMVRFAAWVRDSGGALRAISGRPRHTAACAPASAAVVPPRTTTAAALLCAIMSSSRWQEVCQLERRWLLLTVARGLGQQDAIGRGPVSMPVTSKHEGAADVRGAVRIYSLDAVCDHDASDLKGGAP